MYNNIEEFEENKLSDTSKIIIITLWSIYGFFWLIYLIAYFIYFKKNNIESNWIVLPLFFIGIIFIIITAVFSVSDNNYNRKF